MSIPTSDLDRVTRLLRTYFDNDQLKRFDLERYAGNGANALTWKIKYKPRRGAALERIVLKMERLVAFFDENAPDPKSAPPTPPDDDAMDVDADMWNNPIKNEEKWLKILKWAKHIVRLIEVPNDPLRRKIPGIRPHHGDDWLYLEWVENGSVEEFITKANDQNLARLPNRLLWRFFMCLIRMCIALAWPPQPTANNARVLETVRTTKPRPIQHNDIHDGNVMIGPFVDDIREPEHDIAPMLKLIDFGSTGLYDGDDGEDENSPAIKDNIADIGAIMTMLARLTSDTRTTTGEFVTRGGRKIQTYASEILPDANGDDPCPDLDRNLRNLICLCRATDPKNVPTISAIANLIHGAIQQRDVSFYNGDETEEDDIILMVLNMLLFEGDS